MSDTLQLHPLESNQNGMDVITLPKEEFLKLQEMAEDYQDLLDLEEAIENNKDDPGMPYEEFRKTQGL